MTTVFEAATWRRRTAAWPGVALALTAGWLAARLPLPTAALLLGLVAGALLLVRTPLAGLAAALLVGPLGAWEATVFGRIIPTGQLILWLTLAVWLAHGIVIRRALRVPRTPLNGWLGLFLLVTGASLWQATSVWDGVTELGKWVEIALVLWLVVDVLGGDGIRPKRTHLLALVAVLLAPALVQAALGMWQFALRGDGPAHLLIAPGFYRAYGTFQQPNPFGGYLSLNLSLALGTALGLAAAVLTQRRRRDGARLLVMAVVAAAAAAVLAVGLLSSWSRGAWLGFLAALAVAALFVPRRRGTGVALLIGGALLAGLAWRGGWLPPAVADRLLGFLADFQFGDVRGVDINDANFSVIERLAHWQAGLGMARDALWRGVGFGNYEAVYSRYALLNWPNALGHAHNYYLNMLAETGIPGLLAYLAVWGAVFTVTLRTAARTDWPERGIALGLLAGWVGLSVHHLLDNLLVNNLFVHLGALLGLLALLALPPNLDET